MCLIVIAHQAHPEWPFIVAANRDEFHARPSQDAHWWPDRPEVLGGRDLQAGGSWFAIDRRGRFAAVTNFRDAEPPPRNRTSRGELITAFLDGERAPLEFLEDVDGDRYGGFNLLVGDADSLAYLSNRDGGCRVLMPGIYGVANATLDTPWPKLERSKERLAALLDAGSVNETSLLRLLDDRERARVDQVESGTLPFDTAHALTAPFIVTPEYGTRCSTVVFRRDNGLVRFVEKRFDAGGAATGSSEFRFDVTQSPS